MNDRLARAQGGDAGQEQALVQENLPLVFAIVKRFVGRGTEYDDLVQLGSLGLLKAIRKFDVSYGVCFSTYAVPLIAGEIKSFLRDDGSLKVSRPMRALAARAAKLAGAQPELTVDAMAGLMGCSREEVALALNARESVLSLDAPTEPDGAMLLDMLSGTETETPAVDRLLIGDLLAGLPARERLILQLRFWDNKTQAEVAARLGISQVQVSRLEKKTLLLLRERAS